MDNSKILLSKISNVIYAVRRGRPYAYTVFLNFEESRIATDFLKSEGMPYVTYGGYDDAERVVIGVYSDFEIEFCDFPIVPVALEYSRKVEISHKDVLGSLMSLGIKRETLGDIIFTKECPIVFTELKMSEYIIQNLVSVKNCNVTPYVYSGKIDYSREYETLFIIVSSLRLDCIISEIASVPRTKSSQLIESGFVFVNGSECIKKDKAVAFGDIISVRKKGKFKISDIVGKTKKDRIKLEVLKYK